MAELTLTRRSTADGRKLHKLRGQWTQVVYAADARTGVERVLFRVASPGGSVVDSTCSAPASHSVAPFDSPAMTVAQPCDLPHELLHVEQTAADAATSSVDASSSGKKDCLASAAVWARLTAALTVHDWHAARVAKVAVEDAQRVRACASQHEASLDVSCRALL